MKLRDDLNAMTPRLRRYARALTSGHAGGSELADDLVHATLMRALGSRNLGTHADLVVRLYATLTQLHRDVAAERRVNGDSAAKPAAAKPANAATTPSLVRQSKLTAGLMSLSLEDREALLLVALENFDHAEAARILRVSRNGLLGRLTRARIALETQLHTRQGRAGEERERHPSHLRLVK